VIQWRKQIKNDILLERGKAGVLELGQVLRLEVLLGLLGINDKISSTVVPVDRAYKIINRKLACF
jgi:hypothetical protein